MSIRDLKVVTIKFSGGALGEVIGATGKAK